MNIDHVHFYVKDAGVWRDWFAQMLGFRAIATLSTQQIHTEIIGKEPLCFVLSSPLAGDSSVAAYLQRHPPGVANLAFQVNSVDAVLKRAIAGGAVVLQPIQTRQQPQGTLKWAQIAGWGDLTHTLVESGRSGIVPPLAIEFGDTYHTSIGLQDKIASSSSGISHAGTSKTALFTGVDHAVLNVEAGDLQRAVSWYEAILGFQPRQQFAIQTDYSGLCSRVLVHPDGTAQLPINEPASASSQIQEFLTLNRGAGVQHIALRMIDLVGAIARFRQQGLSFLPVPPTYYDQLRQRDGFRLSEAQWQAITDQEVLVDWQDDHPDAALFQVFTQPIFEQPTFFFELIERQTYRINQCDRQAEGFGEGNFRALFEAIEREQMKREKKGEG